MPWPDDRCRTGCRVGRLARARRAQLLHVPGRQRLEHRHLGLAGRPVQRGLVGLHAQRDHEPPPRLRTLGRPVQSLRHALHRGAALASFRAGLVPVRRRERRGTLPVRCGHADRGGSVGRRRPARHHGEPRHVHPLRALRRALQPVRLDRRFGGDLEPQFRCPAPGRMDVGRRGRSAHPARAAPLRRGAVGRHHPRHPHDGTGDRHLVPVAGPPRSGRVVRPEPPPDGGSLPAQG